MKTELAKFAGALALFGLVLAIVIVLDLGRTPEPKPQCVASAEGITIIDKQCLYRP